MSTELQNRVERISLTRFFGGKERGPCIQLTWDLPRKVKSNQNWAMLQLTKTEAAELAKDLLEFAAGESHARY